MSKPNCKNVSNVIARIKTLQIRYNALLPFFPRGLEECTNIKNDITNIFEIFKEEIRIKWKEYEVLNEVELELAADLMDDVIITSDNKVVTTSGNSITIYELSTGKRLRQFRAARDRIRSLTALPSGFATTSEDGLLQIWNTNGKLVKRVRQSQVPKDIDLRRINNILPLKNGLAASEPNAIPNVALWDLKSGKIEKILYSGLERDGLFGLEIFELSERKISISRRKKLEIWDIETGEMVFKMDLPIGENIYERSGRIFAIKPISENEIEIFLTSQRDSVILNTEKKSIKQTQHFTREGTKILHFTSDGNEIAYSKQEKLRLLDFVDVKKESFRGHPIDKDIKYIKETGDHKIITIDESRKISFWGIPKKEE